MRSFTSSLVITCLIIQVSLASAAVLSIDLGSEWMKVAVVNPKPGRAPINIVLNEFSKRKSQPIVAFSNGDRLLGEEAAGIIGRYPERVFKRIRDYLGKPAESAITEMKERHEPYAVSENVDRKIIQFQTDAGTFLPEELVAMVLGYAADLSEASIKGNIRDAVISVPPFFGPTQRQALLDAAEIAGLNVLALVNEHSAVALQYGIDKDFANGTRNVVFYDMGAGSTYVAVVQYSSYQAKDRGRNVTFNQFQVLAVRWDGSVGGDAMESRLVNHFADEFTVKSKGLNIWESPKAVAKLRKEAKKTKEILSANTEAPMTVEALMNDIDFRSSIKREVFESLCTDLWVSAVDTVRLALEDAKLELKDIDAFEVVGGATRVPKVQAVLSDYLKDKVLDRHLDADEAITLGGALQAANLSDGFKLNRRLGIVDGLTYGINYKIDGRTPGADAVEGEQVLFPRLKRLPMKLIRSFKGQLDDFRVAFLYQPEHAAVEMPPGVVEREFLAFNVKGVANASTKYSTYNTTGPMKVSLHFDLSRSGTLTLEKATAAVEVQEMVEVPVPPPPKNTSADSNSTVTAGANATAGEPAKASADSGTTGEDADKSGESSEGAEEGEDAAAEGGKEGSGGAAEAGAEAGAEGAAAAKGEDAKTEEGEAKPATVLKLKKRTLRTELQVVDVSPGPGQRMKAADKARAIKRLAELKAKDAVKRETAAAKNELEAYIYSTREKLDTLENIDKVSTEAQREKLKLELSEAEDWLYMDGEHATAEEYRIRLGQLKKYGIPILERVSELKDRPVAVAAAKDWISSAKATLELWNETKPWITEADKEELLGQIIVVEKWLAGKLAEQEKRKAHESPAFLSEEVQAKLVQPQEKLARLSRIPKPRPKPAPKVQTKEGANGTASNTTTTAEGEGASKEAENGSADETTKAPGDKESAAEKDEL